MAYQNERAGGMIDNLALGLSHGLMLFAAWRLLRRPDLDDATAPAPAPPVAKTHGWTKTPDA